MIPFATTTVAIENLDVSDMDGEPYSAESERYTQMLTGVRAVINPPTGRAQIAGGEQSIWDAELVCDPIDLHRLHRVVDEQTGFNYAVVWLWTIPGDHTEAGLRYVAGET